MANNRMYLLHRMTGRAVYLGKRMGGGWYDVPQDLAERVVQLFDYIEQEGDYDDVCVAMEDSAAASVAVEVDGGWVEEGMLVLGERPDPR